MSGEPRFFFDYVDPLCWLWERVLALHEQRGGAAVVRHPLELRPPPAELIDPEDGSWLARWEDVRGALPAGERPPRPLLVPWTRKAHELALLAAEKGLFQAVHGSLFRAYVEEGRDIGRVDVLVELAMGAGLDRTETKAVLDVDRHSAQVVRLRAEAERLQVRGVPSLLARGRLLEGASPAALQELLATLVDPSPRP